MVKRLVVKKRKKSIPELSVEIPASGIVTVGNDSSATITLDHPRIAPEQFVVVCESNSMTLLCRVDGTKVNGQLLKQGGLHELRSGDEISVAGFSLTLDEEGADVVAYAAPAEPLPVPAPVAKPDQNLADVLETLRAEEKFYFLIEKQGLPLRRIFIEAEELKIGWDADGEPAITDGDKDLDEVRGVIRKDWRGVTIEASNNGALQINGTAPWQPERLKNDDIVRLRAGGSGRVDFDYAIRFHEPTALLLLDSILPKNLPPPITFSDDRSTAEGDAGKADALAGAESVKQRAVRRNIFGFFTITEIIIMIFGTLLTAAMIFLALENF